MCFCMRFAYVAMHRPDTELSACYLQVQCPADMCFALRCSFPDYAASSAAEHLHLQGLLALPGCPPSLPAEA